MPDETVQSFIEKYDSPANRASRGPISATAMEAVLLDGDLAKLSPADRVQYYQTVCRSLGLNPLTQPFSYLRLNGKLVLYAKRDCTDQLRKINNISIEITGREETAGCYVVTASASTPQNRKDESLGAVPIESLKGESRSNAMMKAETKAKRRVTLSICGLAFLDESELESVQGASHVMVNAAGEITGGSQQAADELAKEKIAAITAGASARQVADVLQDVAVAVPAEVISEPLDKKRPKRSAKYFDVLEAFKDIKKRFQALALEDIYYDHLHKVGVNHSSGFSDDEGGLYLARQCFKKMSLELSELEVAAKKATE